MDKYQDRQQAGTLLAAELKAYATRDDVLVLALPRGGVPVAFEIAKALKAPLDVFIVRKLGVPGHSELAMGAMATGDTYVFNEDIIRELKISPEEIQAVIRHEQQELNRREVTYRGNKSYPSLKAKTIILVDDGVATGATIRAAIKALRQFHPANLIVAVPVADKHMCEDLKSLVDKLICPLRPLHFYAVGAWYENFPQTEDEEVTKLLRDSRTRKI
jgi:putative phosphoribosyl transferase